MRTGCVHYSARIINALSNLDTEIYISNNDHGLYPKRSKVLKTYNNWFTAVLNTLFMIPYLLGFTVIKKLSNKKTCFYFTSFHPWNIILIIYSRILNIKTIQTIHDSIPHEGEAIGIRQFLKVISMKWAHQLIFLTEDQRQLALSSFRGIQQNTTVIPHPLLNWNHLQINKHPFNEKLDLLFVGRINKYKGLELFMESIKDQFQNLGKITIAGKFQKSMKKYENPNLHIIDQYLSELEIAQLISEHHVIVLPYTSASQSGIIPLGIESNTPMIISKIAGLKEQISEDACVFIEPEVSALKQAILFLSVRENFFGTKKQLSIFKERFEKDFKYKMEAFKSIVFSR